MPPLRYQDEDVHSPLNLLVVVLDTGQNEPDSLSRVRALTRLARDVPNDADDRENAFHLGAS